MDRAIAWYASLFTYLLSRHPDIANLEIFVIQDEAVPESLKNILLVMANGKYLVPPTEDPSKEKLWVETKKRLQRFLPDLFEEIFPSVPEEMKTERKASLAPEAAKTRQEDDSVDGD